VRQTELLFLHLDEVRGKDNHARGTGPMLRIKGRIILSKIWILSVSEDRFDEVEVAHHAAGRQEAHLPPHIS
jgi:hypothetical protein